MAIVAMRRENQFTSASRERSYGSKSGRRVMILIPERNGKKTNIVLHRKREKRFV